MSVTKSNYESITETYLEISPTLWKFKKQNIFLSNQWGKEKIQKGIRMYFELNIYTFLG